MTTMVMINVAIWLLMLLMIAFTKYDYGVIAIFISMLLIITGCISAKDALAKYADSNVIIMSAMMMSVAAFSKTKAIKSIPKILLKVSGGSFYKCMCMFMLCNAAIGVFMSGAITRIAIVYPLIMALCEETGHKPSEAMFPIGCCMLSDQFSIPLGGPAVTFARWNGFLESANYTYGDAFVMTDPFKAKVVPCVIMIIYWMTIGLKIAPKEPPVEIKGMQTRARKDNGPELTDTQDKLVTLAFFAQAVALVIYDKLGVQQWMVPVMGAIAMGAIGALKLREAINSAPWSILLLYIGAITMGSALVNTGTGLWVGNLIAGALGGHPSTIVLYTAFYLVCLFLTQFMNNGATANMLMPIAIMTCNTIGCSALGAMICIQQASLVAWFMPTATAIIPMLMDGGGYDIKSLIKQGAPAALVSMVASIAWVAFMFPAYA